MGDLTRKVIVSIDVDSSGNTFLKRTPQIWDGDNLVAPGRPHRQQIVRYAGTPINEMTGIDTFADVPAQAPLPTLAGDRWDSLAAIIESMPEVTPEPDQA